MGCVSSNCVNSNKNEIEVDINDQQENESVVLKRPNNVKEGTPIYMKAYIDQMPDLAKINKNKAGEQGSHDDLAKNGLNAVDAIQHHHNLEENKFDDIQLRIGKPFNELNRDFENILDCIRAARKDFLASTAAELDQNREEKLFSIFNQWKSYVYEEICRKTGEVKNYVTYNSNGKILTLSHEIEGWKEVQLLQGFCQYAQLDVDNIFLDIVNKKLDNIGSLTILVSLDITESESGFKLSIGASIIKPSDKYELVSYLEGSSEKENIMTWFNANQPVPLEFGFYSNENDSEVISGFYFFDGPPHTNLSKALSALQAYGAEFSKGNIELFRNLPGEEVKVSFHANRDGVQKVRLYITKLSEELLMELLEKLDKNYNPKTWAQFSSAFSGLSNGVSYALEFNCNGYAVYCRQELGTEMGSQIYFEL